MVLNPSYRAVTFGLKRKTEGHCLRAGGNLASGFTPATFLTQLVSKSETNHLGGLPWPRVFAG
jgi:hypothetical protein